MINIKSSTILKWCFSLFTIICIGHILAVITTFGLDNTEQNKSLLKTIFYFGYEKNITALFSAGLFILLGCYFRTIASNVTIHQKHWHLISYIAIFLACDEWFAIHDASLNIYGLGLFNIPIWVWVYGSLALILLLSSIRFLATIPSYLMKYLIISGFVYISGSAIMEVVTYSYKDTNSILENIGWFFEDGLEMSGTLIMITAASKWLKNQNIKIISFKKWPTIIISLISLTDLIMSFLLTN